MKKLYTFCLLVILFSSVSAQSNEFTFFSVAGEKFYVILDGKNQNDISDTQVILKDLAQGSHTIKIMFDDKTLPDIDYDLRTENTMGIIGTRTFAIVKSRKREGQYEIDVRNTSYIGTTLLDAISTNVAESNKPPCERENIGFINLSNNSNNPYNIYVDGVFITTLNGGYQQKIKLKVGPHSLKCEQVSGYMLYPTIKTVNVSTTICSDGQVWKFPF